MEQLLQFLLGGGAFNGPSLYCRVNKHPETDEAETFYVQELKPPTVKSAIGILLTMNIVLMGPLTKLTAVNPYKAKHN